ncbi:MAG: gamma-glutamyl-gamma-aminobutyrate hydrolase family protein [Deltaproteobacteria bacterium]|nr:gamma-glutamyl-gamma-aminobutyrate hydrolase family protein [Deltaproteobacteria bacterium]
MAKIWVLQHIICETLGTIADALDGAGISYQYIRPFAGDPVPKEIGGASGLIVMGGPMGVYEQGAYPFLADEMHLIEKALRAQVPILGVCLGSQLLAATLGAAVTKGQRKEIGWYPVTLADSCKDDPLWSGVESPFIAYHWHGDVFELPTGATALASSALTRFQAFRYGQSAYGFLFHMEVTPLIIRDMVETFGDELHEAKVDGADILQRAPDYLPRLQATGSLVFQRWSNPVVKSQD